MRAAASIDGTLNIRPTSIAGGRSRSPFRTRCSPITARLRCPRGRAMCGGSTSARAVAARCRGWAYVQAAPDEGGQLGLDGATRRQHARPRALGLRRVHKSWQVVALLKVAVADYFAGCVVAVVGFGSGVSCSRSRSSKMTLIALPSMSDDGFSPRNAAAVRECIFRPTFSGRMCVRSKSCRTFGPATIHGIV